MKRNAPPPWSVPVAIRDVPETGRRFDIVAEDNARSVLAKAIGLHSLPHLEASFDVTRHGREGLRVVGRVSATVEQTCVVTLEPITSEVEESVDLIFAPPTATVMPELRGTKVSADDAPEPLVGGTIDLGVIATEFLALGIEPYPRKPDAVFTAPAAGDKSGHPFAALAALKKGPGRHDG